MTRAPVASSRRSGLWLSREDDAEATRNWRRAIPADDWIHKKVGPDQKSIYNAIAAIEGQYVIDNNVFTEKSVNLRRPNGVDGIDILIGSNSDSVHGQMEIIGWLT